MAKAWSVEELTLIVKFGGGLDISAKRLLAEEALQIAKFASKDGATITFRDTSVWTSAEALSIAKFGNGKVIFAD